MNTVTERPKERENTSLLNHPVNEALCDYSDRRVHAAALKPASFLVEGGADALPSMFERWRTSTAVPKPHNVNRRGGFSPYVIFLFLLAFAPLQAALLTSEEGTIEQALTLTKRSIEQIGTLLSVPSAEAAISSQSHALGGAASFENPGWSEALNSFKLLLADQTASTVRQAENDRLLRRLEVWMYARTQKSAKLAVR
jgi:hypothetical protein